MDHLLPADPELELLHTRDYQVRAFLKSGSELLIRGAVRDTKPVGLYLLEDPDPLVIHHMVVDLTITFPEFTVTAVDVVFETHPHTTCPMIIDHYQNLIGLSIGRGFTHRVREVFGGPRGCTHTTALLQAMAPVAVQCAWSMQAVPARREPEPVSLRPRIDTEDRKRFFAMNANTCHVWSDDGEQMRAVREGRPPEPPLWITNRLATLGLDPDSWREEMPG